MSPARIAAILLVLIAAPFATADDDVMNAEIDHLLETVATSDCIFIRNGDEHDAAAAVDHLSLKRRRGARYFDSADEFIERIASKSSWSGKPYHIRCDGVEKTAAAWFTAVLETYRKNGPAAAGDGE